MMLTEHQTPRLVTTDDDETTLYIGEEQAMQGWERDLMEFSADLLATFGGNFAEAGLGLGYSALRVCSHPHVKRHTVVEVFPDVIKWFSDRQPRVPDQLDIVCDDFFLWIRRLKPGSLDGIFFDPALPKSVWDNEAFWADNMPWMVRAIRPGGAFVPFFSTKPEIKSQFIPFFKEVRCYPHPFEAYRTTNYVYAHQGLALVQCFLNT